MTNLYLIELRTAQWSTMLAWYRTVLPLRVAARVEEDRFALLVAADAGSAGIREVARLAILGRDDVAPAGRVSFSYEVDDLAAAQARLAAAGSEFSEPRQHREGFREMVTHDPDGNQIRLFEWPVVT